MAKQLQVRRGTTMSNNLFTGAAGEITMDTTTKGLHIHDGSKRGGYKVPTLVDVQYPSAENNYTWYRKYSDGWVEQGGLIAPGTTGWKAATTIALPVEMENNKYYINWQASYTDYADHDTVLVARTTTSFTISRYVATSTEANWEVKGMAA